MHIVRAIEQFMNYGENVKGYAKTTLTNYEIDLNIFYEFCDKVGVQNVIDIRRNLVEQFMVYMAKEKGWKSSTRARRLSALKKFLSYLDQRDIISKAPSLGDLAPSIEKKLPTYLNLREAKKLLTAPYGFAKERDQAILATFLFAGLRVSELINLKIEDIDFTYRKMIINGKGSKQREIPIQADLYEYLVRYIDYHRIDTYHDYVFTTKSGHKFYPKNIGDIVKKYVKEAGIKKDVTPHTLRHTFATLIYDDNELLELKELLGHSSVATTQIYAHINSANKKATISNNPLASKN